MFFSNKFCYAQVWRTADNQVVAAASTLEKSVQESLKEQQASLSCAVAAGRVGELVAQRAQQAGLSGVHWPRRRGERFHGKRAALVNAMRAAGLTLV